MVENCMWPGCYGQRDRRASYQREKGAHLIDLKRDHLIDQVCVQEILPPEK
jgi:hypothetical protein